MSCKDLECIQLMKRVPDLMPIKWSRRCGKSICFVTMMKYMKVGRMNILWI